MRGGQMDRRVTFERPAMVDDPVYGPQPGGWAIYAARVPAQVLDDLPSKAEYVEGAARVARRPARLRMRYLSGITVDMRVTVHDTVDTVFQIVGGPAEIGRREWTEITIEAYST